MNPLWRFDLEGFRAIHVGLHRDWLDPFFWVISTSGLGYVQALLVLTLPLFFGFRGNVRRGLTFPESVRLIFGATLQTWRNPTYYVMPLLWTVAVSGLFFAQATKQFIAGRERPSLLAIAQPQEGFHYNAFPSGHTTTSFGIAFMLLFLTWGTDRGWMARYAFVWATLVGISRIYRGVHWPTDVIGGVFAGLVAASTVYLVLRKLGKLVVEAADTEQ